MAGAQGARLGHLPAGDQLVRRGLGEQRVAHQPAHRLHRAALDAPPLQRVDGAQGDPEGDLPQRLSPHAAGVAASRAAGAAQGSLKAWTGVCTAVQPAARAASGSRWQRLLLTSLALSLLRGRFPATQSTHRGRGLCDQGLGGARRRRLPPGGHHDAHRRQSQHLRHTPIIVRKQPRLSSFNFLCAMSRSHEAADAVHGDASRVHQ